jgi:hypothetical protein
MRFGIMLKEKRLILKRFGAGDRDRTGGGRLGILYNRRVIFIATAHKRASILKNFMAFMSLYKVLYRIVAFNIVSL